ncbi:glycosyltransferase [Nonomuraea zeae]|uniref:Glycosyltransferase n=1 Tax=Nonomuraea zeae TaxID=1642303 RepID=A0A5S4HJR9_9ACTN|nr:glycosyltransferase [Nonomuraea zeae]TMR39850.1 glycosyltransferase [Nonomuraea zeae]
MSVLMPTNPAVLATAVADSLVIASDLGARRAGLLYWELAQPWTAAVVKAVQESDDPIRSLGQALADDPADPGAYFALTSALLRRDPGEPAVRALFDLAWQAECNSRVGYHIGRSYGGPQPPVPAEELIGRPAGEPPSEPSGAGALIVIPFRDRDTGGVRLRNLLACLLALRDQSAAREEYRVMVVESDDVPRWREHIEPYADHYLFAPKSGLFNKSWAVNAGVMNCPGQVELVCILDADVLADREFVARNVARFQRPGTAGHLTYRDMFCLDDDATSWAIRERIHRKAAHADPAHLRGFLLRRPPGCCLWVRRAVFEGIGGMDERYEGWGGEDHDFVYRFDIAAPFDSYEDPLLHMTHPEASVLNDDGSLINAHIPPLSWKPAEPIGRLDRFARAEGA